MPTLRARGPSRHTSLPFEKCGATDPVLVAEVRRLRAGLLFTQDPNDLLFREP